jgi:phosphoribosyl 1,2-cyclic phosphodiesterase
MILKFWGVRGSIPTPEKTAREVGGNTACASIQVDGHVLIFDAGTGIRKLGQYLADREDPTLKGHILLSHYHWDHIQGLPFFLPALREDNRFDIYGEPKKGTALQEILAEQMEHPYFPVDLEALQGLVTFVEIMENSRFEIIPDMRISTIRLNHPNGGAIGYRCDHVNGSFSYISDHEHPENSIDHRVVDFTRNSSVLVHDSQYMPMEKKTSKAGWGHSSWEEACLTAKEANVSRLFLFHHDPDRSDEELWSILKDARQIFPRTELATESVEYDFSL